MIHSKDQMGQELVFEKMPQHIISLVPSQSEYLWDLGLQERLVGISKFCVHPKEMFQKVKRVGGTKNLDLDAIRSLKPDLIIGNKEENDRTQIEELRKEFKVWMSDIYTFEDAFDMMAVLGELLGKKNEASKLVKSSKESVDKSKGIFCEQRTAYFIWNDPYLFAGSNTFIHHVLEHIGLKNVLRGKSRYPELSVEALRGLDPELCLLSTEPFPFDKKHVKILQEKLPGSKVVIADGEMFSWYGSRLMHLHNYFLKLKKEVYD